MAKQWGDMNQAEKIEDLRKDMKATMAVVNAWADQTRQLGVSYNELMKKVSEVAGAVQALAAQPKQTKLDIPTRSERPR